MPATASATTAKRSSAGVSGRAPLFCQGSFATTSRTSSRSRASRASRAATRWPTWMGSKVPPKTPTRRPAGDGGTNGSGAGQRGDHRGEVVHLRLVHDEVAHGPALAPGEEHLDDLVAAADQRERHLRRVGRVHLHEPGRLLDHLCPVVDDAHEEGEALDLDLVEPVAGALAHPGE